MLRTYLCAGMALLGTFSILSRSADAGSISNLAATKGLATGTYSAVSGNPLYQGQSNGGENPLYKGSDRVIPPGFSNVGLPSEDAKGNFVFQSLTNDPATSGVFARSAGGGVIITVRGRDFADASTAPSINNAGQVVFKDIVPSPGGGMPIVKLYSPSTGGNVPITVVGANFGYQQINKPALFSDGSVAFTGVDSTGQAGLFVHSAGGGTPLTIYGATFGIVSPRDIQSGLPTGKRIHTTITNSDGTTQVVSYDIADDNTVTGPQRWSAPELDAQKTSFAVLFGGHGGGGAGGQLAVSNGDKVYLCGKTNHLRPALKGDGTLDLTVDIPDQTIIQVGDALDGSTVTAVDLSPDSWTPGGSLVFWASLADGSSSLYQWTVPEPTTIACVAIALPMIRRRRR